MNDLKTGKPLDRDTTRQIFKEIGERLAVDGRTAEIAVYGGIALSLMYDFRNATQDVDFTAISGDISMVRKITTEIGSRDGLSEDWFNDAVEIFQSDTPDFEVEGEYGHPTGLRVFHASPRYIFAMKCMAMRSSFVSSDPLDVWHLIDKCGFKNIDEAINLVARFYPDKPLPERNRLVLMDLFDAKQDGAEYDKMLAW